MGVINMENNKLSLMFSGGLDSYIAYFYAKSKGYDPLCLFVDMGQSNAKKEIQAIEKYKNEGTNSKTDYPWVQVINFKELVPLIQTRLTNQIIPSRNVLLATIGSMFSPIVWINALDGEANGKEHDKSDKFFSDVSSLLSFTNEFFQPKTTIESPFSNMSKAETISWALNNGIQKEKLLMTNSCYSETHNKCGKCLTCYKRYTAFLLNGIEEEGYSTNPLTSDYAKEMEIEIPKAHIAKDYSRFTEKRIKEHFILRGLLNGK
jgi:7-cyano-7-deazaguanine synthase in queuosine biosynthesis